MTNETDLEAPADGPKFPKWLKWGLIGALAVLIIGYGAIFLYANVIKDSPDELDESDLDAALALDEPADEAAADEPAGESADEPIDTDDVADEGGEPLPEEEPAVEPAPTAPPADEEPATGRADEWNVTDASEFGYRVDEVLFGVDTAAVGRSNQITGSFLIEGSTVVGGEFVVDVASIERGRGGRGRRPHDRGHRRAHPEGRHQHGHVRGAGQARERQDRRARQHPRPVRGLRHRQPVLRRHHHRRQRTPRIRPCL